MAGRLARIFYGAALVTLPMCGMGTLHLVTGRDWGFGLQPAWVFLALAYACEFLHGDSPVTRNPDRRQRSLLVALGASLLVLGLSGLGILVAPSGEPGAAAWSRWGRQVVQLLIMLAFVVWPALWTVDRQRWAFTLRLLFLGAGLQVAYGILQQWNHFHPGPLLPWLEGLFTSNPAILSGSEQLYLGDTFQDVPRLRGTMCEPLYLGNYLLLVLPWLAVRRDLVRRPVLWLAAVGLLLLLTWSRGAWLALVAQVLLAGGLLWLGRRPNEATAGRGRGVLPLLLVGGLLAGLLVVTLADVPAIQLARERLVQTFSSRDWSNLTRIYSMQAAWRAFLVSPWVGVGWGQFAFHFPLHVDPMGLQSQFSWPVVNNFPLKILCETGVVGFLVLGGQFLWLLGAGLHTWRRAALPGDGDHVLAALVAVAGVWLQLLTFSQYNLPHIWLAVGLLLAAVLRPDSLGPDVTEGRQ